MATQKDLNPSLKSAAVERFEREIRKRVVGQDEAVNTITNVYQTFLAKMNRPNQPIHNIMFLGPTGTGKTRLVEAMAEVLFGSQKALIKVDCGEFQHSHEIAKLVGSPPGYLGFREMHPVLTQESLDQYHTEENKLSLVLFDEIEKASDALWKILLGITDKATLTLGDNRKVDFRNCIIFMTSNVGASELAELVGEKFGFGQQEAQVKHDKLQRASMNAAKSKFPTEFINRIDKFVTFKTLTKEDITQILEIELGALQQNILNMKEPFVFSVTDEAKAKIIEDGFDPKNNARPLKRAIEKNLVEPLSSLVASQQIKEGYFIRIRYEEGQFKFRKVSEKVIVPLAEAAPIRAKTAAATTDKINSFAEVDANERFKQTLADMIRKKRLERIK